MTSIWLIISIRIISKDFKMYRTINDVIGEKTINLSYPIHSGREIAVVSMLNNNVQYQILKTSFSHGSYFRHKKDDSKQNLCR